MRLTHEIPKPKDWQTFQRNCVLLFREELNDPNTQEYGRLGQNQRGIDILGKRNGDPQSLCRHPVPTHYKKPLTETVIIRDCREPRQKIEAGLKEIVFATTAPNDTHAFDAAIACREKTLRAEGYDLAVAVHGWEFAPDPYLAVHEGCLCRFLPVNCFHKCTSTHAGIGTGSRLSNASGDPSYRATSSDKSLPLTPAEVIGARDRNAEDPALHAKLDAYRDIFKDEKKPDLAEKLMLALLEKQSFDGKPWARFRIETNLGTVAFALGREGEARRAI